MHILAACNRSKFNNKFSNESFSISLYAFNCTEMREEKFHRVMFDLWVIFHFQFYLLSHMIPSREFYEAVGVLNMNRDSIQSSHNKAIRCDWWEKEREIRLREQLCININSSNHKTHVKHVNRLWFLHELPFNWQIIYLWFLNALRSQRNCICEPTTPATTVCLQCKDCLITLMCAQAKCRMFFFFLLWPIVARRVVLKTQTSLFIISFLFAFPNVSRVDR